jgi:Asparaginase.
MESKGEDVVQASQEVIEGIGRMGSNGGMIVLDKNGHVAMPFNIAGMYRGL